MELKVNRNHLVFEDGSSWSQVARHVYGWLDQVCSRSLLENLCQWGRAQKHHIFYTLQHF